MTVGARIEDMRNGTMKDRVWYYYAGAAALATFVYFVAWRSGYLFNVIALSAPVMILVGVRLHRPARRAPWLMLALGMTLFLAGDVITYNYQALFGTEAPFPSIGDVLYLSVYPCLAAGLLMMVRLRTPGRDWTSLLDSMMVAVAVATVSWVFIMSPTWHVKGTGLEARLWSMAYPVMDLILLTVAVRLAVGAGRRAPSLLLMLAATAALFVTDTIYAWILLHRLAYTPGSTILELGWAAFYVGLGMAALHPSMCSLTERAPGYREPVGWGRLALLGSAALVPPTILLIQYMRGVLVDSLVLVGATLILFLLVTLRMVGLVRLQVRYAARERTLRVAGSALVTATNRETIMAATIEAVRALAGADAVVRVCERDADEPSRFRVAYGEGAGEAGISLDSLEPWERERLGRGESYQVPLAETRIGDELLLEEGEGWVFVGGLSMGGELRGLLVVVTSRDVPRSVGDALDTLLSQVALALESAQLTEELLRRRSEARFASLIRNSSDVVALVGPDFTIRYVTPSASRVLGYSPAELQGGQFVDLIHPEDRPRALSVLASILESGHHALLEFRMLHQDGKFRYTETLFTSVLHDPDLHGVVLNTRDISERKAFEKQLAYQAFHDPVTGLANRALFRDRVLHALDRQERGGRPIGVLFMDLDDFKTINDSLGHAAGDQLLHDVGERLRRCLRAGDTAARLGGDEFGVLLEDAGSDLDAPEVAERLIRELAGPYELDGKEVTVGASVGVVVSDTGRAAGEGADELLRKADVAMYIAKERGKGRYQVYESAMHEVALKRLELKADLQRAVDRREFLLDYQPIVDLSTGRFTGVEALVRWRHPRRGVVAPAEFIPLAEETGLIVPIGQWVLTEACGVGASLRARMPAQRLFPMAVNLSARQLQDPSLITDVHHALETSGLQPHSLILEITETVVMLDLEAMLSRLHELKALGVRLAIDDFGTGYSSLNSVRRFPVDILKVDKSFIDGVDEEQEAASLTAAVIGLAGNLNLVPVAEGIERQKQLERLQAMSCDLGQGFLFSPAVSQVELEALLSLGPQ